MRRLGLAAVLLSALTGCQCAALRDDLVYPCEADSDCVRGTCLEKVCRLLDAGAGDAGAADAGGTDAGPLDAGALDAGQPDAGAPDAGSDGGNVESKAICNDWGCASSQFVPWDGGIDVVTAPCPGYDGGAAAWFGAVLTPAGVIGVPLGVPRLLRVDPATLRCELIGDDLGVSGWQGGVYANGYVWLVPHEVTQVLRVDPFDGGTLRFGPPLTRFGSTPRFTGGVLDELGRLWMVSSQAGHAVMDLNDGGVTWPETGEVLGGMWGLTRAPATDTGDWLFTAPIDGAGSQSLARITTGKGEAAFVGQDVYSLADGGGGPLKGGALRADGTVLFVPYVAGGDLVQLDAHDGGIVVKRVVGPPVRPGFTATGPDGEVWALDWTVHRLAPSAVSEWVVIDGGVHPDFPWTGVVATRQGLIGIPGRSSVVIRVRLSSGEARSPRALLSPYFNKL